MKNIENKVNQIIYVKGTKLSLYNKINNKWTKDIETRCIYGKNGFSYNKYEGDLTTPIGIYPLLFAFGTEDIIKTNLEYKKITPNSYYSNDISKPNEYNKWIESKQKVIGEHLIEFPKEYHYAISIGYNINPTILENGSAIFLHCRGKKDYTAGCIAVDESVMLYLLKKLNLDTYIIIKPNNS